MQQTPARHSWQQSKAPYPKTRIQDHKDGEKKGTSPPINIIKTYRGHVLCPATSRASRDPDSCSLCAAGRSDGSLDFALGLDLVCYHQM